MVTKPAYIKDLEKDIDNLKVEMNSVTSYIKQSRENQDRIFEIQGKMLNSLHDINICLAGTEYEQGDTNGKGGGIMKRLCNVEKFIEIIKSWKVFVTTRDAIIYIVLSIAVGGIWSIILINWNNIFHN